MIEKISPMLAVAGEPFDDPNYLFEIKWDGVRALATARHGQWRLWGRDLRDYEARYPELDVLAKLPSGTVVDGELVLLRGGRADLAALQRRHHLVSRMKITHASHQNPVAYVLFDLLYERGQSVMDRPLRERRARLTQLVGRLEVPRLQLSEGIVGPGRQYFEQAAAHGHEGIMAKHLTGRYVPGRRSSAWRKIKPFHVVPCVIIGYRSTKNGLRSVLVAAQRNGTLNYVAELTCGFTERIREQLVERLASRICSEPVVACPKRARWVRAELFCRVRYLDWTARGRLAGASFHGLIEPNE